jgi:hypothetical protein
MVRLDEATKGFRQGERAMVNLVQPRTATPQNNFSTTELVGSMMHKLSPKLQLPFSFSTSWRDFVKQSATGRSESGRMTFSPPGTFALVRPKSNTNL